MNVPPYVLTAAACLLLVQLAVVPALALPSANAAAVTIHASAPEGPVYRFGDQIRLSGTNTASNTTFLFLTGRDGNAPGSRLGSDEPGITPVHDGDAPSFTTAPVGPDHTWSLAWDTRGLRPGDGTYTVYAVSSPRDATRLGGAIYDSVALNFSSHFLTASVRPAVAEQGDIITIAGNATGQPQPVVAIWIIGPEYSDRVVVTPDEKQRYSYGIDSSTKHLLNGTYHVFVEHPSADEAFDFDLNGDYLFNSRIRSNIFTFRGNGRLYGDAAYTAFTAAINGPSHDDIFVPLSFTMGTAPASAAVADSPSPAVPAANLSANATLPDGMPAVPATTTAPERTTGRPVADPPSTAGGNATGTPGAVAQPGGDGGDSTRFLLPGIFLFLLIAAVAAGAFLRFRRGGTREAGQEGQDRLRSHWPDGEDPHRTGGPVPAAPGPVFSPAATAGMPPAPVLPAEAFPDELAGRYTGIVPVGSGGFAMVYSAYRTSDDRRVAVKIPVRSDERTGKSFLHEIRVWETLHHPNIVEVLETNILPVPYVEMEYVPGSLDRLAKPVDTITAVHLVRGIAEGIRYAHARRCIHRDIKPQNILLTKSLVPKITDWGISKILEESTKKTTVAGFSLAYAAPEQIAPETFGSTDERTDIYQIGAVFYELVTGSPPFNDESMMELVRRITTEDPLPVPATGPYAAAAGRIISRCLAKDKDARYQSAEALLEALGSFPGTEGRDLFEDTA